MSRVHEWMLDQVGVNECLADTLQGLEADGWEVFALHRIYHPHADGWWEVICRRAVGGDE